MSVKRIHRKIERTVEGRARIDALRSRFQKDRPTPEELIASGEYDGPVEHGAVLDMMRDLASLRAARIAAGLTLEDVSQRSGIDKSALSRLENGRHVNPTYETIWRYAAAIGKRVVLSFEDEAKTLAQK